MKNSIELLVRSSLSLTDVYTQLKRTMRFGSNDITITRSTVPTKNRIQDKRNAIAFYNAIQREGIKEAAKLVPSIPPVSVQDAIDLRRPILDAIDAQMQIDGIDPNIEGLDDSEEIIDDTVFDNLRVIQSRLIESVPPEDQTLPNVVTFDNPTTRNSLALAHELYASVDREQDIIDRNNVRHPGFVPGGVALEVLTDVES